MSFFSILFFKKKYIYFFGMITAILTYATIHFIDKKNNPCNGNDVIKMIETYEGWRNRVYFDIGNIKAIGYGFTRPFLKRWGLDFKDIDSKTKGKQLVKKYCNHVDSNILKSTHLNKKQRRSVFSLIYNIGEEAFKSSRLNLISTNGKVSNIDVCGELIKFVNARGKIVRGLINRRFNECKLMWT